MGLDLWLLRAEISCMGNVWTGPYKFEHASQYFLLIFQIYVSDVPSNRDPNNNNNNKVRRI